VRGIDAQRIVAVDQVGGGRYPHEQDHDEKADGAEQIALRQERQPAPAMRRVGAGASQLAIIVDGGQAAVS